MYGLLGYFVFGCTSCGHLIFLLVSFFPWIFDGGYNQKGWRPNAVTWLPSFNEPAWPPDSKRNFLKLFSLKNYTGLVYSGSKDWHLSASWWADRGPPWTLKPLGIIGPALRRDAVVSQAVGVCFFLSALTLRYTRLTKPFKIYIFSFHAHKNSFLDL